MNKTNEQPDTSLGDAALIEQEARCHIADVNNTLAEQAQAPDAVPEQAAPAPTYEELQALLAAAQHTVSQEQENALRAKAEMENLRRRTGRDIENAHRFGIERLVNELLPVIDSLELGLHASDQEGATVHALREGAELTLKMFLTALEKYDLQVVNPIDTAFDPEFHQAMSMQKSEDKAIGTILQVVQKGYTLSGRLVRPAMVIVTE